MERRWPFLRRSPDAELKLEINDLLEYFFWRSPDFTAVVIGAFDGVKNDALGGFIARRGCRAVMVEPQLAVFERLSDAFARRSNVALVNAALDERSGERMFYSVDRSKGRLPAWTEQLASFDNEHILKHEPNAPGLSDCVVATTIPTISFDDLIRSCDLTRIGALQIDAEGFDAQLLRWFPFDRIKPNLLHYETAHMSAEDLRETRDRLAGLGYRLLPSESPYDDVAIFL